MGGRDLALPNLHVVFFRGRGLVADGVRFLTWEWWRGQAWRDVPAHVALFWSQPGGALIEIEAIVSGIRFGEMASLPTEGVAGQINCHDAGAGWAYASSQVGRRYGFEAAALTGLASLPWWRSVAVKVWAKVGRGRTAPLHCSLLAVETLRAAGYGFPAWDTPPSPNVLLRWLEGNDVK